MPTPKSPSLKNAPATPPEVLFADALEKLVGVAPDRVEFPGGKNRKTAVAVCGDEKWVISRRSSRERAGLEAGVLAELGRFDGPVPQLIAHEGTWII